MSYYRSYDSGPSVGRLIAAVAAVVAVVSLAGWLVIEVWLDSSNQLWRYILNSVWRGWLFPNGWNLFGATPFFWLLVLVLGLFAAYFFIGEDSKHDRKRDAISAIGAVLLIAWLVFAILATFQWGNWNAQHYNKGNTYVVNDTDNLPGSLYRVSGSSTAQVDIVEGTMPTNWERRPASASGAANIMRKTGDTIPNTALMRETTTYIYNDDGTGYWSAIRNGTRRQPVYGVAMYRGTGENVTVCQFTGKYELNKAFNGTWGKNLNDVIAAFDRNFIYSQSDVYGYCGDDNEPIIVIPGSRVVGLQVQTALESHGVLIIKGSPTGAPKIEYRDTIKPGDLPGPAYPTSLVDKQRDVLGWSAGRVWWGQVPVGYVPTNSSSQLGNNTDFLLRNKEDGRLYWVTPMKPANADSETVSAYGLVAADEITSGKLNDYKVYVLDDNDPNIVNFNDLSTAVTQAVAKADPGFFTGTEESIGRIVEFVPTGPGEWAVFGERDGRAAYQINVSGGTKLNTAVIDLSQNRTLDVPSEEDASADGLCDDPSRLTNEQIARCINDLSSELVERQTAESSS